MLPSNPSLSRELRLQGNEEYKGAKRDRCRIKLRTALTIFRRAAEITNTVASERASAHKNVLACLILTLQWDHEDSLDDYCPDLRVDDSFFAAVREASSAYASAAAWATGPNGHPESWQNDLTHFFYGYVRRVSSIIAVAEKRSHIWSSDTDEEEDDCDLNLSRFRFRIAGLLQLLRLEGCPLTAIHKIHLTAAEVTLKASVVALSHGDFRNAVSIIAGADHHLVACVETEDKLDYDQFWIYSFNGDPDVSDLQSQILYQRCAAESAQKIHQGLQALQDATEDADGRYKTWTILPAIDLFKEAQVLARETSLEQEAQATARLAKIFKTFPDVKDEVKSTNYYNHAFNMLQSLGPQCFIQADWAIDVRLNRERVQRERSDDADAKRVPVLETNKELLREIKVKMETTGKEGEALLFLYERYPPKRDGPPKEKIERGDLKSAMKTVLLHYHPDRNREDIYGFEHSVLCEEITKMVNILYGKMFKDV